MPSVNNIFEFNTVLDSVLFTSINETVHTNAAFVRLYGDIGS
jgi:hypothetical protein